MYIETHILLQLELNVDKTLSNIVFNQLKIINVPKKWLNNIDVLNYTKSCQKVISVYKMGTFKSKYYRYIEKQLVITEGLNTF
ncbi:Uncharacterized protein FWK35_00021405 [Aphis craccivora]|uniref:Uncharacterized protein n=1 Tax=Aphis craccivora TaxID=307492 RepID=A0A6G0Y398_APHCR|nr:Uncharacterized protein FWK35_00021405 [Aphis craccivora]